MKVYSCDSVLHRIELVQELMLIFRLVSPIIRAQQAENHYVKYLSIFDEDMHNCHIHATEKFTSWNLNKYPKEINPKKIIYRSCEKALMNGNNSI